jgi:hypothetical protein
MAVNAPSAETRVNAQPPRQRMQPGHVAERAELRIRTAKVPSVRMLSRQLRTAGLVP